jgi:catechol 2,3-dioxygenase-like lactoylglutathione lyase family enzyme
MAQIGFTGLTRREWLGLCAATSAYGFQSASPLFKVVGLDHVSLSVADGQRTVDFYRPILGQEIFLRPKTTAEFRIGIGGNQYMAINPGRDVPLGIVDHFSIGVKEPADEIRALLTKERMEFTDAGYVKDKDGIAFQVSQSADVNPPLSILRYPKTAAVPGLEPVFRPKGLGRVRISVNNVEASMPFYRKLCGVEPARSDGQLSFRLAAGTVVVREVKPSKRVGIDDFTILVERYDRSEAAKRLKALGVELRNEPGTAVPFFADPDGITVYISEVRA